MDTSRDQSFGDTATVPNEIAGLDVEVQAMFERVRVRLGMRAGGPEMIGRYELRDWIASGGMGQVYRAYDVELEREVALKLIAPRPGSDPQILRTRLRREAQMLARLDHDNVVRVFDAGIHEGRVYLVMELVVGATLRQLQTAGSLSKTECLRLYAQAGRGLLGAHERGVVHRDFKPENVFVGDDGRARVGDFGLAHTHGDETDVVEAVDDADAPADDSSLTQVGERLGTLAYMAPEQLMGESVDARADQYAFCVALWEALDGTRPFPGASPRALLHAMHDGPRGGEAIDARLRKSLQVGLARDPEQRHASMAEVVAAIEAQLERPVRRQRVVGGVLAMLGVVGVTVAVVSSLGRDEPVLECPLADEVAELRLAASGKLGRSVMDKLTELERDAKLTCRHGDDLASEQHIETMLLSAKHLLHLTEDANGQALDDALAQFERDFVSKGSVPMSPERYTMFAAKLEPRESSERRGEIVEWCEEVMPDSETWEPADRAELALRCARVGSLVGHDYEEVVRTYKRARRFAAAIGDDQRRLTANLGAAKTTIMRLEDYELGKERLELAGDLIEALGIGPLDPRRADYDELGGILARETGDHRTALRLQLGVVLRQLRKREWGKLVAALTNLGNHLDDFGKAPHSAELAYRLALAVDPDDPEARVTFGCVLVYEGRALEEARALLEGALEREYHDLEFEAALCILSLSIYSDSDEVGWIATSRDRLIQMLVEPDRYPRAAYYEALGWFHVALAYAHLGDFGADYQHARSRVSPDQLGILDEEIAALGEPEPSPEP